jgi:hypothetical protein
MYRVGVGVSQDEKWMLMQVHTVGSPCQPHFFGTIGTCCVRVSAIHNTLVLSEFRERLALKIVYKVC